MYNTPLGRQHTQPTILNANFSGLPSTNPLKYGAIESRGQASPLYRPGPVSAIVREKRSAVTLEWRPSKENQVRLDESREFKNGNRLRSY